MTDRISIPALRHYALEHGLIHTVEALALVEAVEAAQWLRRCELDVERGVPVRGMDEAKAGVDAALARFDFGEDPLEGSRPFREVLAEIEKET